MYAVQLWLGASPSGVAGYVADMLLWAEVCPVMVEGGVRWGLRGYGERCGKGYGEGHGHGHCEI